MNYEISIRHVAPQVVTSASGRANHQNSWQPEVSAFPLRTVYENHQFRITSRL